ncbi:hypothetical protein WICPIJ_002061 [Wickerhamomyces pijperi]|uniref:Uncharacterized protein n=1 Tax=Wickerhamomyces pijperi TaxID=599730 RepID=A0A9P8Q9T9_WICPI|nr:hypothetical protein WICPIJ_002061 [Wickerhamomyces pijperi]
MVFKIVGCSEPAAAVPSLGTELKSDKVVAFAFDGLMIIDLLVSLSNIQKKLSWYVRECVFNVLNVEFQMVLMQTSTGLINAPMFMGLSVGWDSSKERYSWWLDHSRRSGLFYTIYLNSE